MGILEELTKKRLKWVEANRENGFEKGLRQLLTKLYPDNAHFIYELMQNAEDPRASKVRFVLTQDSLEFEHNGEKLFTLQDVESITSIGASSKLDDPTNIGEFGVGFKAVFDYTNTPEIHSGEFHFRIKDLVAPETNGVMKPKMGNRETRFSFPFDHPNKPPAQAKEEIERTLINLGDNTLLFLSNIRTIEYLLPDGSLGSLERVDHGGGRIEIHTRHPSGSQTISHWLRFQKEVEIQDESGETERRTIAIAFRLEKKKDNDKKCESDWVITPIDNGQVSIYFPAENEASNLRFHIHAPFASTVARDSVRNCQANRKLLNHIANLVVDSLPSIRDEGMLTVGFLGVLPNPLDYLDSFYEQIREAVVRAFRSENLTPTKSGAHSPAINLYSGPAKISDTINDDDLSMLTDCQYSQWAANPQQQNQREGRFLESLDINEFSWTDLIERISIPYDFDEDETREHIQRIERWIEGKNDAWLMRFYSLLGEARVTHRESWEANRFRIVRVELEQGHAHVLPADAFFPPDQGISPPQGINFVKSSVYDKGRSEQNKIYARSFLELIGVRPFDERAIIELKLRQYDNPPDKITKSYYSDLKTFIKYWKNNPHDAPIFRKNGFLLSTNNERSPDWCKPSRLCLDSPYEDTGLSIFSHVHYKKPICREYKENIPNSLLNDFIDFMKAVGVMHEFTIEQVNITNNPQAYNLVQDLSGSKFTNTALHRDYSIFNLDKYLQDVSIPVSRLLWHTLINADPDFTEARFRPNQTKPTRTAKSQLVYQLMYKAWIPDKSGVFRKPEDLTKNDLRTDFPYDDRNGFLTAIGFGERDKKRTEDYQLKNEAAKSLGLGSSEEAEEVAALLREHGGLNSIRDILSKHKAPSQPEASVPNPERRRKGILDRMETATTKESIILERTIQLRAAQEIAEAKAYLLNKYTNEDRQTCCQCCRLEMPFKVNDDYYFEAIQCIRKLDKHHPQNRLALCPTCAAMYQHARQTNDEELTNAIIEHRALDTVSPVEIMVRLAGRNLSLRFVAPHWFDLKTVLERLNLQ